MFSITNKNSLIEAEKFLEILQDHGKYNQVPVIAVGNKNDLEYARLEYMYINSIHISFFKLQTNNM